jgi:hypothetical protein
MIRFDLDTTGFDAMTKALLQQLDDVEAYIVNFVPYVPRLEFGWSKQAPHGMVRISVPEIGQIFCRALMAIDFDKAAHEGKLRERIIDQTNLAAEFGMQLIRDRTPIKTGRARRGWEVIEAKEAK